MKLKIFALNGIRDFGQQVANKLEVNLSEHEEYCFDDGECYIAPRTGIKENVRGCDVFVISSMYSDEAESVNDKIMKTLILCGSLRDASAARITLVAPYYPYARQDRKTASRAPITTKYIARIMASMWVDRILCIDVHNPTAIQNAHHIPCDLLEANTLFASHIKRLVNEQGLDAKNFTVLSPDSGGLGRARKFRKILSDVLRTEVSIACLDKIHAGREIRGYDIMGRDVVIGRDIIIFDDMISSGKTTLECVNACMPKDDNGELIEGKAAHSIFCAVATHGLFVGKANEYLDCLDLKRVLITDSIRPFRLGPEIATRVSIINTTRLFAEAIARINKNESISDLLMNGHH
jgi:ribose-phosphate pyrophosphokinase